MLSVTTQIVVDKVDPAFKSQAHEYRTFYTKEEAEALRHHWKRIQDEKRTPGGIQKVVASPSQKDCDCLMGLWESSIVIPCL